MTDRVAWVEKTPVQNYRGGREGKYQSFFDSLRSRPEIWAEFPRQMPSSNVRSSVAAQIRHGRYIGAAAGEFEARSFDGVLLARYVGGN